MRGRYPVKVRMNNLAQELSTASEATYSRHFIRVHAKQLLPPEHPGFSPPVSSRIRRMANEQPEGSAINPSLTP